MDEEFNYSEQLKDSRWISLRAGILDRDWHMCQKCMSGKNLEVHHKCYIRGHKAWEYTPSKLITLCANCHNQIHASGYQVPIFDKDELIVEELWYRVYQSADAIRHLDMIIFQNQNG